MEKLLKAQKAFFASAETMEKRGRLQALEKLRLALRHHEEDLLLALHVDWGISREAAKEMGLEALYEALEAAISHLKRQKNLVEKIRLALWSLPGSHKRRMPWGTMLIISDVGDPIGSCLRPLIAALEAGNCAVVCPMCMGKQTMAVLSSVFEESFEEKHAALITGGWEAAKALCALSFDRIWFLGGRERAKEVSRIAGDNATPIYWDIQGNIRVIVSNDADVREAAKKIAKAKFFMSGQTLEAPGCCLVSESVMTHFLEEMIGRIEKIDEEELPKISDGNRVSLLSQKAMRHRLVHGGSFSHAASRMEPTLLSGMKVQEAMEWEALPGPVLALAEFRTMEEGLNALRQNPGDTLCYFSKDQGALRHVLMDLPYQTMICNDCRLPEKIRKERMQEAVERDSVILCG